MSGRDGWATTGNPKSIPAMPVIGSHVPAAVVAAVDAAVVLQVEALGVAGVAGHLVHALPELEVVAVGQEAGRRCRGCWPATVARRRRTGRRRPPRWRSAGGRRSSGWTRTVCRHSPPPPGCHCGRCGWSHSPRTSEKVRPPSSLRNSAAGSTPAYRTSARRPGPAPAARCARATPRCRSGKASAACSSSRPRRARGRRSAAAPAPSGCSPIRRTAAARRSRVDARRVHLLDRRTSARPPRTRSRRSAA